MKKVMVNIPFKVAGGKSYDKTGKTSMTDDEIKRALAVNPNMVTVLPDEESVEDTGDVSIDEENTDEDAEPTEDAEPKKLTRSKKADK